MNRTSAWNPQNALVDEGQKILGSVDQLLLLRVEIDELLKVRFVPVYERIHVSALCVEELPKELLQLRALGLGRIGQTNTLPDRPEIRGMIARVPHLIEVSGEVSEEN